MLAESLKKLKSVSNYQQQFQYILHGGNLIYEIGNWKKQAIFQQIANQCTDRYTEFWKK